MGKALALALVGMEGMKEPSREVGKALALVGTEGMEEPSREVGKALVLALVGMEGMEEPFREVGKALALGGTEGMQEPSWEVGKTVSPWVLVQVAVPPKTILIQKVVYTMSILPSRVDKSDTAPA